MMTRPYDGPAVMPALWPLAKLAPPIGTIVHVLGMAHLTPDDASGLAPMPGGMFAEVTDVFSMDPREGTIRVLTVPASADEIDGWSTWDWVETFPFELHPYYPQSNCMKFELPPADVCDAVRAFVALSARDDNLPIIVEDGWLC